MNEEILQYLMNQLKLSRENILSNTELCDFIEALEVAGASLQKHPEVYKAVTKGVHLRTYRISDGLDALKKVGAF